jgi:MOSC domain-containing protein YiiM
VGRGVVEGIFIASARGEPTRPVGAARAIAGQGLEGDRHFAPEPVERSGNDLTLIEAEALEALAAEHGIELGPGESRRNVVTRGIALNDLVGQRFRVGDVECLGRELCEPCRHLHAMTQPGVLRGLVHRGGLNADVLDGGEIRVGDAVATAG